MATSYSTNFYTYMYRNLSIMRDVAKLIYDARSRNNKAVIFRDEQGQAWQLVRVGGAKPKASYTPSNEPVNAPGKPDYGDYQYGTAAKDSDCLKP